MSKLSIEDIDKVVNDEKLAAELQDLVDNHPFDFPLDQICEHGGWPPEDGIDLTVRSIKRGSDHYAVEIAIGFDEVVPTSCGDIQMSNSVHGEFELKIDRETGEIEFLTENES